MAASIVSRKMMKKIETEKSCREQSRSIEVTKE